MIGLRRPTTNFERDTMTHLRQRMRSPRTIHTFSNDYMAVGNRMTTENAFAPDNILRFCGENVITFRNLESYPSKVADYQSDTVGGSRSNSATAKVRMARSQDKQNPFFRRVREKPVRT